MHDRVLLSMIAVAATMVLHPALAQDPPRPRIVCDEPVMNYGEVDNSRIIEHTFVLRNDGNALLEIGNVRPACGCTVANVSRKQLEPGETAEITTRLSLQGRLGRQRKTMAVESNDPATPVLTLTLDGVALTEITVSPQRLFVGDLKPGSAQEYRLDVVSNASDPVSILSYSTGNPLVTAELETVEEGRRYAVVVRLADEMPRGPTHGRIQIQTDSPKLPTLQVPFQFNVVGDLSVAPEELAMVEQPDSTLSRNIVVRPGLVRDFKLLSVTCPEEEMETTIRELGGNGYMIQVNNIHPTLDLNGKVLIITTDVPGMEEITVPFRVVSRPRGS